ncbi:MAG TPA: toxin-antitoxin system HicB family antitoxin [Gammaproteobacteria bacterium]|nr:toxin-antitoxin system HicB family antitoxin [Gammaproteobacteria bacterium]
MKTKKFMFHLTKEQHKQLKTEAIRLDVSMNELIMQALNEKLMSGIKES